MCRLFGPFPCCSSDKIWSKILRNSKASSIKACPKSQNPVINHNFPLPQSSSRKQFPQPRQHSSTAMINTRILHLLALFFGAFALFAAAGPIDRAPSHNLAVRAFEENGLAPRGGQCNSAGMYQKPSAFYLIRLCRAHYRTDDFHRLQRKSFARYPHQAQG